MPFLTIPPALGHPVIDVPSLHDDAYPGGWTLDLEGIKAGLEAGGWPGDPLQSVEPRGARAYRIRDASFADAGVSVRRFDLRG